MPHLVLPGLEDFLLLFRRGQVRSNRKGEPLLTIVETTPLLYHHPLQRALQGPESIGLHELWQALPACELEIEELLKVPLIVPPPSIGCFC